EDHHTVEALAASPAAPQIAIHIDAQAVTATLLRADEDAPIGKPSAVSGYVIGADSGRRRAILDNVECLLVRRKGKTIRPVDIVSHHSEPAGLVEPINIHRQLRLGDAAVVVVENAVGRIGEPDRVVGLHHHVVGRIEPLTVEFVGQHGYLAVVFRAGHASRAVLAGDQAALTVSRVTVCLVRWTAKHADRAGRFIPTHDAVVGGVAPQQIAPVAEPDRALAPRHAGGEPLHANDVRPVFEEAWIEYLDGRVRIARARRPVGKGGSGEARRRGSTGEHSASRDLHELSSHVAKRNGRFSGRPAGSSISGIGTALLRYVSSRMSKGVFAASHKRQKSEADIAGSSGPPNRAQVISADLPAGPRQRDSGTARHRARSHAGCRLSGGGSWSRWRAPGRPVPSHYSSAPGGAMPNAPAIIRTADPNIASASRLHHSRAAADPSTESAKRGTRRNRFTPATTSIKPNRMSFSARSAA